MLKSLIWSDDFINFINILQHFFIFCIILC